MAIAQTPAAGVAISGHVVDAYPGVMPQPDFVLYRRMDGPPVPTSGRVPVRPDRTFVIDNLAAGLYELYANYSFPRQLVTVGATGVTGIELVVSGQSRVIPVGRMDDGSEMPPGGGAVAHIAPLLSAAAALESPDGFTVPPGQYWLFVVPPAGTFVKSVVAGDVDLWRVPLRVEPGSAPRRVDVVLTRTKPADAPVTTVTGSTGQAGLDVELVDLVHGRRATLAAATTTDASGVFRFENVVPGFYRINLPPAERVVDYLVVGADAVTVDIPVPSGTRIIAGAPVILHYAGKRMGLARPAGITLIADREGVQTRIAVSFWDYWGALAPGAYRLTLEGIQSGFSVRSLKAGSVNLLEQPFVVPVDRPAERIELELDYVAPE